MRPSRLVPNVTKKPDREQPGYDPRKDSADEKHGPSISAPELVIVRSLKENVSEISAAVRNVRQDRQKENKQAVVHRDSRSRVRIENGEISHGDGCEDGVIYNSARFPISNRVRCRFPQASSVHSQVPSLEIICVLRSEQLAVGSRCSKKKGQSRDERDPLPLRLGEEGGWRKNKKPGRGSKASV